MAKKYPNILFFGIDSLRSDHTSLYGYKRLTTPHIDAYIEDGGIYRIVTGKALCYLMVYAIMAAYLTLIVPRIFSFIALCAGKVRNFILGRQNINRILNIVQGVVLTAIALAILLT